MKTDKTWKSYNELQIASSPAFSYVAETIKMLPQKPDDDLLAAIFLQVACLGRIHASQAAVSTA